MRDGTDSKYPSIVVSEYIITIVTCTCRNTPCELNIFVLHQQQNIGRRFGTSKVRLSSPVALATVYSKEVVFLLLIRC